ncbi:hypothetical protein AB0M22_45310 [Nocardia sp. NPDC051756]|uniref:hypothetical protein n=1 Tax=Nocardia sp. NPDC051756 TaxID=3154751 RepID=UPI003420E081
MRFTVITTALLVLPLLAGCDDGNGSTASTTESARTSSSSTSSPQGGITAAELSRALQSKGGTNPRVADCIAGIYVQERLSQDALRVIRDSFANGGPDDSTYLKFSPQDQVKMGNASSRLVQECAF